MNKKLDKYYFYARLDGRTDDLWKVVVETPKGRAYYCWWRKDSVPTRDEMEEAWANDRRAFLPLP